jgi:hypothetical protein
VTRRMVTQVRLLTLSPEWTPNQLSAWQQLDPDMLPVWQALKEGREPSAEEVSEWSDPHAALNNMTPFEALYGRKPTLPCDLMRPAEPRQPATALQYNNDFQKRVSE